MRLATVAQAQQIDELSQKVYGLTGEVLMEAAGALAAREVDLTYLPELTRGNVSVVCGPGNNGGDGLVVARHLHSMGYRDLRVFLVGKSEQRTPLFNLQLQRAELAGLRLISLEDQPVRLGQLQSAELIVDAVFGIGLKRRIEDPFLSVIEAMNSAKAPKVSIDCPSGLSVDSGRVEGVAVKAGLTLSFGLAKPGFFVAEGPQHIGKLRVLQIGFPFEALRGVATSHFLFTERLARRYMPVRSETSNKSDHGRLLVIAGRPGFWGAGILASTSAFRIGVGYVQWASFETPLESLKEIPEVLTGDVNDESLWNSKMSAVAIGPGLGSGIETAKLIERLKARPEIPVVIDADAITACVEHKLFPLPANWIMTPHVGELSRVLKISSTDIEKDRFQAALQGYQIAQCHILLKGYRSILAHGSRLMVIHAGNSALAKAGTGDVLTGMIGGLLAQGLATPLAAGTGAYLHGRLADEWVRSGNDKASMTASDLGELLPQILTRIRLGGGLY